MEEFSLNVNVEKILNSILTFLSLLLFAQEKGKKLKSFFRLLFFSKRMKEEKKTTQSFFFHEYIGSWILCRDDRMRRPLGDNLFKYKTCFFNRIINNSLQSQAPLGTNP